jgi:hypothetical protein
MLRSFTRNYEDNSTEAGFQFTFYCDLCHDGFKSSFVESASHKKSGLFRGISRGVSIGASLLGQHNLGYNVERGSDILRERFDGMSPEWQQEHEKAFERSQNEAQEHYHRCNSCRLWVCDADFNEEEELCVSCAPRMNVAVAAAKSRKMVIDIDEKANQTQIFKGEIESKTLICPQCGKPAGQGKFCNNCGASMQMERCVTCGAPLAAAMRFCGECGSPRQAAKPAGQCPACQFENPPGTKFCGNCGTKI